jgi:hypothetical protein
LKQSLKLVLVPPAPTLLVLTEPGWFWCWHFWGPGAGAGVGVGATSTNNNSACASAGATSTKSAGAGEAGIGVGTSGGLKQALVLDSTVVRYLQVLSMPISDRTALVDAQQQQQQQQQELALRSMSSSGCHTVSYGVLQAAGHYVNAQCRACIGRVKQVVDNYDVCFRIMLPSGMYMKHSTLAETTCRDTIFLHARLLVHGRLLVHVAVFCCSQHCWDPGRVRW